MLDDLNLKNKCGSCVYSGEPCKFSPAGELSWVECKYPGKKFKSKTAQLKPRSARMCKQYERRVVGVKE